MITLKIPYTTQNPEDMQVINDLRRQYSSVVRFAYNRFLDGLGELEIRALTKDLQNIGLLNSWMTQCAIREGKQIHSKNKDKKVIFGGKKLFQKRLQNKISKEEFQAKRLLPLSIQGEMLYRGNRSFSFRELTENKLVFKVSRDQHIELRFPNQRKNWAEKLRFIQTFTETKDLTVSVKLNDKFIYLSYEEPHENIVLLQDSYMGIDLNPNHIGISVFQEDKVVHTESFSFVKLTEKLTQESNASDSIRFKYLNNKLNHETIECAKIISGVAKKFRCKFVFLEDLKRIDTGDANRGRGFNRLTRNLWKRGSFESNLKKRLSLLGIKTFNVNPMYSSVIGNLQHDYFDPCNAACEIGRRGHDVIIKKNKKFYPDFNIKESLADLWKEHGLGGVRNWKGAFVQIKNSKLRYRVPLEMTHFQGFKMSSKRSQVEIYRFSVL